MSIQPKLNSSREHSIDEVLRVVTQAVTDKQAVHVRVLDLVGVVSYTDAVLLASGHNDRQVAAIVENVEELLWKELRMKPKGVEGRSAAAWVCMDYGDVIVHIFYGPARDYYDLDTLWPESKDRSQEFLELFPQDPA